MFAAKMGPGSRPSPPITHPNWHPLGSTVNDVVVTAWPGCVPDSPGGLDMLWKCLTMTLHTWYRYNIKYQLQLKRIK